MCVVKNDYPLRNPGSMKITHNKLRKTKEATMEAMEAMKIIADHRLLLCRQWLGSNYSL